MAVQHTTLRNTDRSGSFSEASGQHEDEAGYTRASISLGEKQFYAFILLETLSQYIVNDQDAFLFMDHGLEDEQLEMALDYLEQIQYPMGSNPERTH